MLATANQLIKIKQFHRLRTTNNDNMKIFQRILKSLMTYHWFCSNIYTTGATIEAGITNPSGAPEFTSSFIGVPFARSVFGTGTSIKRDGVK